jgi:hypothetical protein
MGSAAVGGRSLDTGTQLPARGHWLARSWPQAGEATVSYVPTGSGEGGSFWSKLDEEERRARNHERANKRAVGAARRYMVSNRLRYMWVLTYPMPGLQGPEGRAQCMRDVAAFAERLMATCGRRAYLYSPELHPGGHGWHVNFFVSGRIKHELVKSLWDHGHVWVKDWTQDSRIQSLGLPLVVAVRLAATYGCKYASKDWSEEVLAGGAHRYELAQGFQPDENAERYATLAEAWADVHRRFGGCLPSRMWSSDEAPDWDAPPVYCFTWIDGLDDRPPDG